jgi:O-methyltransferase
MQSLNPPALDYHFFNPRSPKQKRLLRWFGPLNALFRKLNWQVEVTSRPANEDMITVEQRINLFHLENETLVHQVPGDLAEFGCHHGKSALMIQQILQASGSGKAFHVYDRFHSGKVTASFRGIFEQTFAAAQMPLPVVHEGLFEETVPGQLPDQLSFVHIDCTTNPYDPKLAARVTHLLKHVYPRMAPHAIGLIMDYRDPDKTVGGSDSFPGVKEACDAFFADKPEKMFVLYGNQFPHGYFRKGG